MQIALFGPWISKNASFGNSLLLKGLHERRNDDQECSTFRKMRSLHGPPEHRSPGDAALPKEVNLRLDGFNRQEAASATLGHLATNADFTGYVVQDGWR